MKKINIVAWHNAGGLSRDVDILVSALCPDEFDITLNGQPVSEAPILNRRIYHRIRNRGKAVFNLHNKSKPPYDINLFVEDIVPGLFGFAYENFFLPNPEWFKPNQRKHLAGIDRVLCKTRSAVSIYEAMGSKCVFISFTSDDRLDNEVTRRHDGACLHLAGRSWQKGTRALTDLWQQHPEWPTLRVVQNAKTYRHSNVAPVRASNIDHILEHVDDKSLKHLQNSHRIHLCPSEAEGFGHCIAEAMSCRALTLTTNAPPMNELIAPERGLLVNYSRSAPQCAGDAFFVNPDDLKDKVHKIFDMTEAQISQLGDSARSWYELNDREFRKTFAAALSE